MSNDPDGGPTADLEAALEDMSRAERGSLLNVIMRCKHRTSEPIVIALDAFVRLIMAADRADATPDRHVEPFLLRSGEPASRRPPSGR